MGCRDLSKGKEALEKLSSENITIDLIQYDAHDPNAPKKFAEYILEKYSRLDILINNAGFF